MSDTEFLRPGVLIAVHGKEWIVDIVDPDYTYLRPVRDGVAYLPGAKIATEELCARASEITVELMGEILPCPYCKNEHLDIVEYGNGWCVDCPVCDASGPSKPTESEAIAAWNAVAGLAARLAEAERVIEMARSGVPVSWTPRLMAQEDGKL